MELYRLTASQIGSMIANKEITSQEATASVLERINNVENKVNSYITVLADEAIKAASQIDQKIANGQLTPGGLVGVPMALKDNMCTNGIETTCASKILGGFKPVYDAFVAKKLSEAGTVLLGKLNMDEFAMGSSNENSYYGAAKNPYSLDCVTGGSSGGSAAAVAADEAFFTLGSDTGGSIRLPAAFCGIVGLKPTYGMVSRFGLIAFASSLDQIGPCTKDVTDCAMVMNAISSYDNMDSTSLNIARPDYTKSLVADVRGLKIGLPLEYFGDGINPEIKEAIYKAVEKYKEMGAQVEEFSLPLTEYALPAYYIISSAEASSNLARFDGVKYGYRTENYNNLSELYMNTRAEGFGNEVKRRIMLGTYALSSGYYDAYYKKAQQVRTLIKQSFDKAFEKYDIIISPVSPTTAFMQGEKTEDPLQMYLADICTVSINIAGLPAMSIPCGFDQKGLPIGMQLIGKPFDEVGIIKAAYSYEQSADINKLKPTL